MTRRTFDEHVELLAKFGDRVAALSPEAWASIRARCTPLAGTSPVAIYARAQLRAAPASMLLPAADDIPLISIIRGFTFGAITTLAFVFDAAFTIAPSLDEPSYARSGTTGKPTHDLCIDAMHRIKEAVQAQGPHTSGVSTAIDAAAQALLKRDFLSDAQFRDIYRWIEPEIPIASIDDQSVVSSA